MKTQMMHKGLGPNTEISKFDTTRKAMKSLRLGLSATALCYLTMVIGGAVLPCGAETILTTGNTLVFANGTIAVNNDHFGDWNGLPQNNLNQVTVNSNTNYIGPFAADLHFTQNPSTEYGVTWNMTNTTGQDWYGMHFTLEYAPLGNFSVTYDATGAHPSQPSSPQFGLPTTWTDTDIIFSGADISGSGGSTTFYLPLDVFGDCCNGDFRIWATPDYNPSAPEPSSLMLFGSGVLGLGGMLRKRFLG